MKDKQWILTLWIVACWGWIGAAGCKKKEAWLPVPSSPLLRAHAHNDYLHKRPLFDALNHQFSSVEVDVHLVKGKLLVAHYFWNRDSTKTLSGLYLKPLFRRVKQNKGQIYPQKTRFVLLIDIKTNAKTTYVALHKELTKYRSMLTTYKGGVIKSGAVTVITSGNQPLEYMKKQKIRYAAYDGRPSDLKKKNPAALVRMISQKWSRMFSWRGKGKIPEDQRKKLFQHVKNAHKQGRLVRFWATYDTPSKARTALWRMLRKAKVDLINTDDLTGLQQFLLKEQPSLRKPLPRKR